MTVAWEPLWPYRAVLAVDARNFSDLNSRQMQHINSDIPNVLAQALSDIGLSTHWQRRVFGQHSGDGYVAGLDPEVLPALVACFPKTLHGALLEWQSEHQAVAPLQLRVSIHVGPLPITGLGTPMVEVHRMLDDSALRELLARADARLTTTAVVISERVYEDVFTSGCAPDNPGQSFVRHLAKVKKFARPTWLHVPGLDWGLADPNLVDPPEISGDRPRGENSAIARTAPQGVQFNQRGSGSNIQGYHQDFSNNSFGPAGGRADVD